MIRSRDVATINPSQAVTRKLCAKLCSKRNHRDGTETSAHHSETKREITAQNVSLEPSRENVPVATVVDNLDIWRESVRIQHRRTLPQSSAKIFLPGDAFAQLHNLSSYMLYDGASKTVVGCNSDRKHPEFIGLILDQLVA